MSRRRAILLAVLAAVAGAAVPVAAWLLAGPEAPARRVAFENDGTGLAARDVQSAIQELSAKVK
ncbi:MAG TPA: hypothetical protein VEP68_00690, partial [Anaeromyxobacteraceae bacterium]|nr:hypothetical protein [Anaeromyxobacteraceae bacterium]